MAKTNESNSGVKYTSHAAAKAFPLLDAKDYELLKEDIRVNGVRNPIIVMGGEILDGRNRYAACEDLKIDPPIEEYRGSDAIGLIISQNILRRHLTDDQRVAIVAKLRGPEIAGRAEARMQSTQMAGNKRNPGFSENEKAGIHTHKEVAKEAQVSPGKAHAVLGVAKHAPEVLDDIVAGKTKIAAAAKKVAEVKKAKAKASGKVKPVKAEKTLQERVEIKWQRFLESFGVVNYVAVRKIVAALCVSTKHPVAKPAAK